MVTVACFRSSPAFFPPAAVLAVPVSLPLFSLLCFFLFFGLLPVFFPHPAPPAALRFWCISGCLQCCGFSFGCPSVVRVLFSLHFCWFSFTWLSPPASCFFLVPWAEFSPLVSVPPSACCGILHSGFGSFSVGSALLCCCGFMVVCFLTRSNLRFPSRLGLPLGRVRLASASVFRCPPVLSPLRSSDLFAYGILLVSCSPGGLRFFFFFPWRSVSFGVGFFPGRFLFLLVRVAFALLLALPCCHSAVPVFGLSFLLVLGSFVAPFVSSFPLVVLSLPPARSS